VIYLDWNATTPPHPDVIAAMLQAMRETWANPASVHGPGRRARACLDDAREAIGRLMGRHPRDVTLTAGGTEANNLALTSAFATEPRGVLVVGRTEHPSIVRTAEALAERGVAVRWVAPEPSGVLPVEGYAEALRQAVDVPGPRLVALGVVNSETGVLQPVGEVAELGRSHGAWLHVDAVQAAGRLPPASWHGADTLAVAAHKLRGPKGVGALVTKPGVRLSPILRGGSQERGLRPGTVDPAACAGFAVAAERAQSGPERYARLAELRDELEAGLLRLGALVGCEPLRNGSADRAPSVSNLSWPGWSGAELCAALDLEGVAVSSGSACSAGTAEPSPVVAAMLGIERARSAVRVSLGEDTTREEIAAALARWERVLRRT
jgi:cysteine desulfurase